MPLLVDVHPPPDSPPAEVVELIDACSQAAPVKCEERNPNLGGEPGAIVQWRDGTRKVAIWVHVEDQTLYRLLEFSEVDQRSDRIVAAGLLLGSLVREAQNAEQQENQADPIPEAEPRETEEPQKQSEKEPRSQERRLGYVQPSLGLGLGVGLRTRGQLDIGWFFAPHFGAYGQGAVALEPSSTEGVRLQTYEVGAGFFGYWQSSVIIEGGLGFRFQETSAQLSLNGETEQLSTGRPGGALFAGLGLPLSEWFAAVARVDTAYFPDSPEVSILGEPQFQLRSFEAAGQLGVRFSF